jgi:hypothetical protein
MTIEEARLFVAECSERLKGPLSNIERALIVTDRTDARRWIEAKEAENEKASQAQDC